MHSISLPAQNFTLQLIRNVNEFYKFVEAVYYLSSKQFSRRQLGKLHSLLIRNSFFCTANFVATNMVNLLRPTFGENFNKFQVFGTNSATWIPLLLKNIPRDQLPERYGGTKDFKPVRVYG